MMSYLSVSGAARRLAANPRDITILFYQRHLSDSVCPVVDGRRMIPESYLGEVERVLRERGKLPKLEAASC